MSSQPPSDRPATAEIVMVRQQGKNYYSAADKVNASQSASDGALNDSEVLQAISSLRADLMARLDQGIVASESGDATDDGPTVEAGAAHGIENQDLRRQLEELSAAIAETKNEISSLRDPKSQSGDEVKAATQELDAVVNATEVATNDIMEAAEKIDDLAERLRSQLNDSAATSLAEEINENVVSIFEACNFQDITGQRITKVVKTLQFIDERVSKMMELWGAEQVEGAGKVDALTDEDLLHGPALDGEGASQDDIDALFD